MHRVELRSGLANRVVRTSIYSRPASPTNQASLRASVSAAAPISVCTSTTTAGIQPWEMNCSIFFQFQQRWADSCPALESEATAVHYRFKIPPRLDVSRAPTSRSRANPKQVEHPRECRLTNSPNSPTTKYAYNPVCGLPPAPLRRINARCVPTYIRHRIEGLSQ